ncbi:MAG: tRNA (N(6)-L-threonylcarbamoyladenosine(37)-C(2))-methylthiotransferase MtaB [Mageeibacillus sp.]|jgi:threonylcarbamoyladenosine tRNA methylthiotransferase MtaB|nr:tRNA (N(6)-L-threonylcarbamoyladenosine(37)-C(2))-methylthiotransferase MtaB [Mageeibacillus sp.]
MRVFFLTLGCRVNQYETDAVRRLFLDRGHIIAERAEDSDCIIVNTCSVTGEADRKSRQLLRRMARVSPSAVIVSMGCSSELAQGTVDADIVVSRQDKNRVPELVERFISEHGEHNRKTSHNRPALAKADTYHDYGCVVSPEGTRAFMKIEDGCSNFCSYCVIPFARGSAVSRSRESCLEEANFLAESGFKEIIISGIHLCSYGRDRGEDISSLLGLIGDIDRIPGIERIRLGSLEPMSMTDSFISGLSGVSHLCPHFHLSLQSGSDTVLERMNRRYNTAQYEERVSLLRREFPGMSLTTDIITGFPQESEKEFAESYAFAGRMAFSKIHVFPYSEREGTRAASMPQLDMSVRRARAQKMIALSERLSSDFASAMVGRTVRVLVEKRPANNADGRAEGYSENYVRTYIGNKREAMPGDIITGTIVGTEGASCIIES